MNKLALEVGITESTAAKATVKTTVRKSGFRRELNAGVAIVARDILLSLKSPGTLIMSLAMPIVMMGMLGGSLAQNMASGLGFNYGQFMMIGMMVNMLFMMTVMGLSSLVDDHETDFMQEMMISPVSRYTIVIGKIFGSSFSALIGLVGTLIVGLVMGITISIGQMLLILALSPLMCLSAGALAMIILGVIKSNRLANIAVMIITMPQMFLSGAIIPIGSSSGVLFVLSRMMPMTYCLDLVRSVVYSGTPEYDSVVLFNPAVNVIAIISITVACLIIGTFLFARSEKKK
jgi:ABC-2 type transport system permease protein